MGCVGITHTLLLNDFRRVRYLTYSVVNDPASLPKKKAPSGAVFGQALCLSLAAPFGGVFTGNRHVGGV
jgi:hypothetical protein